MAYNNNIPQPGDFISVSQRQFLDNFQTMSSYWNVDHYDLNDGSATMHKHRKMTMPVQGSAPTTLSDEVALYTKTATGHANLFMRKASNGTEIQITRNSATGVLKPEAAVIFDYTGAIIGPSKNIATVQVIGDFFEIAYTTPISTVNYFYTVYGQYVPPPPSQQFVGMIDHKLTTSIRIGVINGLGNLGTFKPVVYFTVWTL